MKAKMNNESEPEADVSESNATVRRGSVYCDDECRKIGPFCDYCKYFDFNGDSDGVYTGDGYCRFHKREADPIDGCADFHCTKADA